MPSEHLAVFPEVRLTGGVDAQFFLGGMDDDDVRLFGPEAGAGGQRTHATRLPCVRLPMLDQIPQLSRRIPAGHSAYDSALPVLKVFAEGIFERSEVDGDGIDVDGRGIGPTETIEVLALLEEALTVLPFQRLRVFEPNPNGKIRCRRLGIRINSVGGGQLEQIVVVFGGSEMLDQVQALYEIRRHLLIRLRQDFSLGGKVDLALRAGKPEPLHLEKEPVRLNKPKEVLRLKSLQLVWLGKAL